MKKIIYNTILIAFMSISCSEDFLNRMPLDEISPEDYFKTANDLKLYANRFYPLLPSHAGYGGGTFWIDGNSDNLVPGVEDARMAGTRTLLPPEEDGHGIISERPIIFLTIVFSIPARKR